MAAAATPIGLADFDALVRDGQRPVTRYLLARTGSHTEAAELTQETFVRAYRALSNGDRPRHPARWLLGIASKVFLEAVRSERYQRQLRERMLHLMGKEWQNPWQEQVERRLIVGNALGSLPADLREPVLLHYFAGLSLCEVASHLEITAGAVKTRLWRARRALRGELEVLVSDAESKVVFSMPRDLAAKARLIAKWPPIYDAMTVSLQVDGARGPTAPLSEPSHLEGSLSFEDLCLAVRQMHAARLAGERPLAEKLAFAPLYELFENPRPIEIWSYLRSAAMGAEEYHKSEEGHLWPSDGWRLGTDPDAPQLLKDFHAAGLKYIWFTVVGLERTHDELCRRRGAFAAIITAMKRCREAGIGIGANIIASTRSTQEVRELAELVLSMGGGGAGTFIPLYILGWSRRHPAYEQIRPEPEDLVGLPPAGMEVNWGYSTFWVNPAACTEGAVTRAALEGAEDTRPERRFMWTYGGLGIWVASNLDVLREDYEGLPTQRIANLRDDSPEQVHERLANLEQPPDPPSYAELAGS